ncbi:hypothetical protein RDI58_001119 [Solanum bulbocastanum]|uniref:Uncharacterized protein n=1 Tax=Solanum bulbocastanum TaxID=147425 RepID=A0AAN8UBY6_SOLBU
MHCSIEKHGRCIELNYNFLPTDLCKHLFLMCSIFSNHSYIPMETLTRYCMGLALIPNIESVKEARHNIHQTMEELKAAYLLLDCDKGLVFHLLPLLKLRL